MSHTIKLLEGPARSWYSTLIDQVLADHVEIPCRQGLGLESPDALSAIIPGANSVAAALATVDLPRRGDSRARTTFSILYSLRRILGYHETVLHDRYPILARYTPAVTTPHFARSISYFRESVPNDVIHEPWVTRADTSSGPRYSIDQFQRAVCLLSATPQTRRALIDFGEGFKARCVLSWLFLIRNGNMRIHQNLRSNDLVVGMPNDLIDARTGQIVLAAITGTTIGELHHHASLIQIYRRDIAGIDTVAELSRMDFSSTTLPAIEVRIRNTPIVAELESIAAPWLGRPLQDPSEGMRRWRTIMTSIEALFWKYNPQCSADNRQCVDHLIGRYA
ncbi:MAG: thymidylate synthase [Chloroflexi bacterium]|nr:thymidylate synthase [Chloroflexota bacterium]